MVTLEPKQDLDCTSWFAAQLVLDDGDLVAVNLLLAEPDVRADLREEPRPDPGHPHGTGVIGMPDR